MKQFSIFSVCLLLFLASCKNGSPTSTNDGAIVLFKSSFDSNSTPNSNGWRFSDSSLVGFSTDVPPNGGKYSIFLKSSTISDSRAVTKIALPSGVNIYHLSVWAKSIMSKGATGLFPPRASLGVIPAKGYLLIFGYATISDSVWREYSFYDTLTTQPGDSAEILLTPEYADVNANRTYFDLCRLEEIP
jgi:hypothetical protein